MRIGVNLLKLKDEDSGIGQWSRSILNSVWEIDPNNEYVCYVSRQFPYPAKTPQNVIFKELNYFKNSSLYRMFLEQVLIPGQIIRDKVNIYYTPQTTLPLISNTPAIITVHDISYLLYPQCYKFSRVLFWRHTLSRSIRQSKLLIAVSQSTKRDVEEILGVPEDKIKVVYNAVGKHFRVIKDLSFLEKIRRKYSLPPRFILFVGLFSPRKNIEGLLRGFAKLKMSFAVDHKLVIVGKHGWKSQNLPRLIKDLSIEGDVHFTGYVPDEDLPPLYNLASVFVLPSLHEGFGIPVIEAMACGTPVLASNCPALLEVGSDAAVFFNPYDVDEIAHNLHLLLVNEDLRTECISKGLVRAKEFSWMKSAKDLLKVFEEIGRNGDQGGQN
jgi:glycosyltransferase involved in cell wall biosynthesis